MENPNLEQAILELVGQSGYRPVKPRVIAQKLGVPMGRVAEVRKAVKRLIAWIGGSYERHWSMNP